MPSSRLSRCRTTRSGISAAAVDRRGADRALLGPDRERERLARRSLETRLVAELDRPDPRPARARRGDGGKEIHLADETRDEWRPGSPVYLGGRAHLLDLARVHDHDAVGHGESFF